MKNILLLLAFFLVTPATLIAGEAESTPQPPALTQELTEAQLEEILGGDLCIVCSGNVTITISAIGVTVECDTFVSISICDEQ